MCPFNPKENVCVCYGCMLAWMYTCLDEWMYAYTYVRFFVCVYAMKIAYDIHHAKTFRCSHSVSFGIILSVSFQASVCGPMETDRGLEMLLKPLACRKLCRYSILALGGAVKFAEPRIPILYTTPHQRFFMFGGSANFVFWRT